MIAKRGRCPGNTQGGGLFSFVRGIDQRTHQHEQVSGHIDDRFLGSSGALLVEQFVSEHNKNVEDKKKFTVGNVTVADDNDYVHYSSTDFSVTLDAIRSKLLKTHGGYLSVRYTESGRFLDYLADFSEYSVQTVEFGRNLLNVALSMDHAERATALIPLGAKIKAIDEMGNEVETDERVGIAAVNDGKNYIFDDAVVKEIGWIWATEIWEDVTLPANLLRKAQARLPELSKGIVSMELTIVDESDTGADIGDIHARQYVDCLSRPHGIDGRYLCVSKTTDYLNPANNTIAIGASGVRLTSASVRQEQNISALEDELLGTTREINGSISSLAVNLHECYSEITKTSEQIGMAVREEYITRSDLAAIQADFETSITQNSTEIRMDFTQEVSELRGTVANNQMLLEEYIRFKGALIELGKVGNAFTAELSNVELAFKENGQKIAYISNQILVITNAEIRNKLSLGNESRGWFDFIPRANGNLSIKWRGPVT